MKKILLILILMLACACVRAYDMVPSSVSLFSTNSLGVYQVWGEVTVRERPQENAPVIKIVKFGSVPPQTFVVYVPEKQLAFFAVTDEVEGWFEVIYNNTTDAKGWIKKDDPDKFMIWLNFYNLYGKQYGLKVLSGGSEATKYLYSAPNELSQVVGKINRPQKINLTAILGNWALVSVYDADKIPKTGYIRWRADNGVKYLFPLMK